MPNVVGNGIQNHEWNIPASADRTFAAAVKAANQLFKKVDSEEFTKTIHFMTKVSAMTWGDRCTAQVIADGDGCVVKVSVASRNANNSLVGGKAAKNMQDYLRAITAELK